MRPLRYLLSGLCSCCLLVACGDSSGDSGKPMEITATVDLSQHGILYALLADGDHCYIGTTEGELLIYDIGDETAPSRVGIYEHASGSALTGLCKEGDLVYATFRTGILAVIDVSNPAAPTLRGSDEPQGASGWEPVKDGDRVFWVGGGSPNGAYLQVTEVGNPDAPQHVSTFCAADQTQDSDAIAKDGDHVYMGDLRGDFYAVDVSDPAAPHLDGSLTFTYMRGVDDAEIHGSHVFFAKRLDGLFVIDVSNPAEPSQVGTFALSDGWAADSQYDGEHLYVAYGDAGLVRVDVSDPSNPVQVGAALRPDGDFQLERVSLTGDLACLLDTGLSSTHRLMVARIK
ncbi:MAG: hypothetical protein JXR96_11915 [Deltaproteobacteria bacterium]|nr:hypothetical protein [Deltaproteobacteria bacterium]